MTALTSEHVADALAQMLSHCRTSVELHKLGVGEYEHLSARGVLYTLGYDESAADEILRAIAAHGFEYCLDPAVECNSGDPEAQGLRILPPQFACQWGADQLLSRLYCVRL